MRHLLKLTKYEYIIIALVVVALILVVGAWAMSGYETSQLENKIYTVQNTKKA